MSRRIRECIKGITKNKNVEELLPEYIEQAMVLNNSYARLRLMMEYYMYYEMISEDINPYIDSARDTTDIFNSFLYEINCNITAVSGLPDLLISFKYGTQTSNITFDRFVICGQVLQEAKHNISKIVKDKFNTIFTVINTVEDMNKKIYSIGEIYETHNF